MSDSTGRDLDRRLSALEHSLASGKEMQAMRDRATANAVQAIESEQTQLWQHLEKRSEKWEALLKDQHSAFNASLEKLRDSQTALIRWAAALLAAQVLAMVLRKTGLL